MRRRPLLPDPSSLPRPWTASYPPGVPPTYRYPRVLLPRFLDDAARDVPTGAALRWQGRTWTWLEVQGLVDALAGRLRDLGVRPGESIAAVVGQRPLAVVAAFATWRVGAVHVPVDPALDADALGAHLSRLDVVAVLADAGHLDLVNEVRPRLTRLRVVAASDPVAWRGRFARLLDRRRRGIRPDDDVVGLDDLLSTSAPRVRDAPLPTDAPAVVLRTGGTAGAPRAVVLSHAALVANAFQARLWLPDVRAGRETLLCALPLWHAYGLTTALLVGTLAAGTLALPDGGDTSALLDAIERDRPTILPASPAQYAGIVAAPRLGRRDLSSIRAAVSGGAPLDDDVRRAFEDVTGGARLREGYGLTEAGPLTHANPVYGRTVAGTAGLPVTDTAAIVVDPDERDRVLPPGEVGVLHVAGPQLLTGYVDAPSPVRAGWLDTGDLAVVDGAGWLTLLGREQDALRRDGARVPATVVEAALRSHPGVAAAAVVQRPDGVVVASVVAHPRARPGPEELRVHVRQRLDPPRVPDHVQLVAALPRTALGKVRRDALRATAARMTEVGEGDGSASRRPTERAS